jgi:hypothetical protein
MENQVSLKANLSQLAQSVALNHPSVQMVLGGKSDSSYLQFTHKAPDGLSRLEHRIQFWLPRHRPSRSARSLNRSPRPCGRSSRPCRR